MVCVISRETWWENFEQQIHKDCQFWKTDEVTPSVSVLKKRETDEVTYTLKVNFVHILFEVTVEAFLIIKLR